MRIASLPNLQDEVSQQLAQCTSALAELPPPITSDPPSFVLNLVLAFSHDVKALVEGDIRSPKLIQDNRHAYAMYKRKIRDSALLFLPYLDASEEPTLEARHLFSGMIDDEITNINDYAQDGGRSSRDKHMYLADVRKHVRNARTRELPDNVPYTVKVALIGQTQGSWKSLSKDCYRSVERTLQGIIGELVDKRFSRYNILKSRMT